MSLLDRFKKTQPSTQARGESGRGNYNGFLRLEELNAELQGYQGLQIFDRMYRTDPDVRRVVSMVINPILGGDWDIEPFGGEDATDEDRKVADAARWALFEAMTPNLKAHLHEALPVLVRSGFCPFEQVWQRATYEGEELLAPRKLMLWLPRTIFQWPQDEVGNLAGLVQITPTKGQVEIDAEDLVYYRIGAEGDNWEGTSMLRPVYKPWFIKDKVEKLDAMGQEREAMGIPIAWPAPNATGEQRDALEDILANVRGGEEGYILMPGPKTQADGNPGWEFEILGFGGGSGGSGRSAQETLSYHSDKITAAFVAEFMRLGQAGVGARATADVQQDPFEIAVEALADLVAGPLNEQLIPRFVALNFADAKGCPKLKMVKADSESLSELGSFITAAVGQQVIHPDDPLEDHVRTKADFPPADPKAREERKQQEQAAQEMQQKAAEAAAAQPAPVPGQPAKPGEPGQPGGKTGGKPPKESPKQPPAQLAHTRHDGMCDECSAITYRGICPNCDWPED